MKSVSDVVFIFILVALAFFFGIWAVEHTIEFKMNSKMSLVFYDDVYITRDKK